MAGIRGWRVRIRKGPGRRFSVCMETGYDGREHRHECGSFYRVGVARDAAAALEAGTESVLEELRDAGALAGGRVEPAARWYVGEES